MSYHEGETGAAANLYAYCNNDPVNYTDFDGHCSIRTYVTAALVAVTIGAIAKTLQTILMVEEVGTYFEELSEHQLGMQSILFY